MARYSCQKNKNDVVHSPTKLEFTMKYRSLLLFALTALGLTACHPYYRDHNQGWDRHDRGHYGPPPKPYHERRW